MEVRTLLRGSVTNEIKISSVKVDKKVIKESA